MNPVHPTDPDTSVECPNCGTSINVESILRGKLSLQYEQQYREKQEGLQKAFEQREHELEKQKQENARDKRLLAEQIEEGVSSGLTKERKKAGDGASAENRGGACDPDRVDGEGTQPQERNPQGVPQGPVGNRTAQTGKRGTAGKAPGRE